jgi:hypothetical protein
VLPTGMCGFPKTLSGKCTGNRLLVRISVTLAPTKSLLGFAQFRKVDYVTNLDNCGRAEFFLEFFDPGPRPRPSQRKNSMLHPLAAYSLWLVGAESPIPALLDGFHEPC